MNTSVLEMLQAEKEALLEALRRDLRSQKTLGMHDSGAAIWHQHNVRMNVRLLEALNPKRQNFARPVCNGTTTSDALWNESNTEDSIFARSQAQKLFQKLMDSRLG